MNSDAQYIQVIKVLPVFEPKEQFKQLNLSTKILKYYHHNEVSKFKFTNRKDSQLNENDPTVSLFSILFDQMTHLVEY